MTINLNLTKNALRLAMLAAITYLILNLTANYNSSIVKSQSEDTTTIPPNYLLK